LSSLPIRTTATHESGGRRRQCRGIEAGSEAGATGRHRILHSDTITLKMRKGGKEIENVETAGPGTIDFLPNHPGSLGGF